MKALQRRLQALEVRQGATPADLPPELIRAVSEALDDHDTDRAAELLDILAPYGLTPELVNQIDRELEEELAR